jgi:predicted nucleic-acid-binding protein
LIGLDTNVLVRYLAQDEPRQSAAATRLIETELTAGTPGFVSLIVLAELCWVLKRLYDATPAEIRETVADLLKVPQLHFERRDLVQAALQSRGSGKAAKSGLVDIIIAQVAQAEGCSRIVSFDKAAVRDAGMTLLT